MTQSTLVAPTVSQARFVLNELRHEMCPMCKSRHVARIGLIDYRTPVMFSTTPISLSEVPELWRCISCRSWFVQNIVSEDQAANLYSLGMSNEKWTAAPFAQSKSPRILNLLSDLLASANDVLDIGCNTGELLDFCKSARKQTFGVEPSNSSRLACALKGHEMYESVEEVDRQFDLITMFDVVEHLHDPTNFLLSIQKLLRPGGHLVLLTGDNRSLTAQRFRAGWWYVRAPEHIVFPSREYLASTPSFRMAERRSVYASVGYAPTLRRWLYGAAKALVRLGEGLPLVGPDHQLVVLRRN